MAEGQKTRWTSLIGCYSATLEELQAEQGRIRAGAVEQRQRAARMREEAIEIRAQSRRLRTILDAEWLP